MPFSRGRRSQRRLCPRLSPSRPCDDTSSPLFAPLLFEAAPDIRVDVLPVMVDEVVDLQPQELSFGVAHHPPEGFVGLQDLLGFGIVEVDGLDALLYDRPVTFLALF